MNPFDPPTAFAAFNSNAQERGQVFCYRDCIVLKDKCLIVYIVLQHSHKNYQRRQLPIPDTAAQSPLSV